MAVNIQLRNDTAANWALHNPILLLGEMGIVRENLTYKVGDGVTAWNDLPFRDITGEMDELLLVGNVNEPPAPVGSKLKLYSKSIAGRMLPKIIGPAGLDTSLQPALWSNGIMMIAPGGTTSLTAIGTSAPTAVGTLSHPALLAGTLKQQMRRALLTSAATATSTANFRLSATIASRGDTPGHGGFFMTTRFGISSVLASQQGYVGLTQQTGTISTSLVPSTLTTCVILGWDAGEANLSVMHNDALGVCTKIPLGANFPASDINSVYEFILFAAPNSDEITYRVINMVSGATATGVLTTDIPSKGSFLTWNAYMNNGGVAGSVAMDFMRFYLETDY